MIGERWAARLEIYETDPAEEPDVSKWTTLLAFRLSDWTPDRNYTSVKPGLPGSPRPGRPVPLALWPATLNTC